MLFRKLFAKPIAIKTYRQAYQRLNVELLEHRQVLTSILLQNAFVDAVAQIESRSGISHSFTAEQFASEVSPISDAHAAATLPGFIVPTTASYSVAIQSAFNPIGDVTPDPSGTLSMYGAMGVHSGTEDFSELVYGGYSIQWNISVELDPHSSLVVDYSIDSNPYLFDNRLNPEAGSSSNFARIVANDSTGFSIKAEFGSGTMQMRGAKVGLSAQVELLSGNAPRYVLGDILSQERISLSWHVVRDGVAPLPELALSQLTTIDSKSVTLDYEISDAEITSALTFNVYRSAQSTVDGSSVLIGTRTSNPSTDHSSLTVGKHTVQLLDGISLPPDPYMPFVVVVANSDGSVQEAPGSINSVYFRKYLLGVVSHGLSLSGELPSWEGDLAASLKLANHYDDVIAFDWASKSNNAIPFQAIDAGVELADFIKAKVQGLKSPHSGDVVDLHFVGHSRGAVVVSQALENLQTSTLLSGSFIKLTLLDPHPANIDSTGGLYSGFQPADVIAGYLFFETAARDPQVIISKNVSYAEVYYQQTSFNTRMVFTHFTEWVMNLWGEGPSDGILNRSDVPVHFRDISDAEDWIAISGGPQGSIWSVIGHEEVPAWYLFNVSYFGHSYLTDSDADYFAPDSRVAPLIAIEKQSAFPVVWSGTDNVAGTGISSYDIYVSDNGGPFSLWLDNTSATSAVFSGADGHTYGFYSVAVDRAGNAQTKPSSAQTTTSVVLGWLAASNIVPHRITQGSSFSLDVAMKDAFGGTDVSFSGAVTLKLVPPSSPAGSLIINNGDITVNAVKGIASFTGIIVDRIGSGYKFQLTGAGRTMFTDPFDVTAPGIASRFVASSLPPATVRAGDNFAVTVVAQDGFGKIDKSFSGAVTIELAGNVDGATLHTNNGSLLTVTAKNGVATFSNVYVDKVGNSYLLNFKNAAISTTIAGPRIVPGAPTQVVIVNQPPEVVAAGSLFGLTARTLDKFGNLATNYTGNVTVGLAVNAVGGRLSGQTSVKVVNGIAVFNGLMLDKVSGNYKLQVTGVGSAKLLTNTISVTSAVANKLVVTTQPASNITAGAILSVSAQAYDRFGNIATSFNGPVTIRLRNNPGGSVLDGITTLLATSGRVVFSGVTLNRMGNGYTMELMAAGLPTVVTNGVNVKPGSATHFVISTPPSANVIAGAAFKLVVSALDNFGNVASGFTGNSAVVNISLTGGHSAIVLRGTLSVKASNGTATFTGLTLNTAGMGYTLQVSGSGLPVVISGALNVSAAVAAQIIQRTSDLATVTVGQFFTVSYQVADKFGNSVLNYAKAATLTLASGPSGGQLLGTSLISAPVVDGAISFANLWFNKTGANYKLKVVVPGLPTLISNSITVV